ncbi:hypothetical protein B0J18DRAFT_459236 [Chaetomium sp. MPI-SDFR-AT-0129]|nr:hypothetical protein B0J18DRAFT_459236 [Chaetomium sp. MPI-SDFR-AT-0129]
MAQTNDPSARLPCFVHRLQPRESIMDPDALTKRLRNLPLRPSVELYFAEAKNIRDELVSLAGCPTRDLISIPSDPSNPDFDSRKAIKMAGDEASHWTSELGVWLLFLSWRKRSFDRRVEAAPESVEPPLPDPYDVDAYALHLEFRKCLLETIAIPEKYIFAHWENSRKRLDTLEPQLAEMRAERGLPADDNPPPPALVALWEDEAAKKAAELAALPPIIQPAFRKRPRGVPPDPSPASKRKRVRTEDHSEEAAAPAPATIEKPSVERRSTRVAQPAEQPPERPNKQTPKKRHSAKAATVVVQ